MKQIQKMGPLEGILGLLPGVNMKASSRRKWDPKRMGHLEAIVLSRHPRASAARDHQRLPPRRNRQRRRRPISEVNKLLDSPRHAEDEEEDVQRRNEMPPSMFGMRYCRDADSEYRFQNSEGAKSEF